MFESSLVESTPILRGQNRWPALISFAVQAAVLIALILIPLLHPEALPMTLLPKLSLVAPSYEPAPPPVPIPPIRLQTTNTTAPAAPHMQAAQIQSRGFQSNAATVDEPALAIGLNLGEPAADPLASILGAGPTGPRIVVASGSSPNAAASTRVTISRGVIAGLLIAPIQPEYPAIAKISHTEGTVIIQAVISTTGHIESAHVLSGPQMLQAAALQAVRNARYRPFLLNDRPTEVETTISITFQMHS
jgi:protein TonB